MLSRAALERMTLVNPTCVLYGTRAQIHVCMKKTVLLKIE